MEQKALGHLSQKPAKSKGKITGGFLVAREVDAFAEPASSFVA